jgi:hypothetical protein
MGQDSKHKTYNTLQHTGSSGTGIGITVGSVSGTGVGFTFGSVRLGLGHPTVSGRFAQ